MSASSAHDLSIAIDFGTSNTVVAVARPDSEVETVKFHHGDEILGVYMSALCFWEETGHGQKRVEGGPWAVEQFLEGIGPHRFLQSFKTFAASRCLQGNLDSAAEIPLRGPDGELF